MSKLGAGLALCGCLLALAGPPAAAATTRADAARIAALESQVQGLLDREAVRQVILTYARTIDARDWATHRSLFMDKVEVEADDKHERTRVRTLDDLMRGKQAFFGSLPATQHMAQVLLVDITGDDAHIVTQLHAQHYRPNSFGESVQRMIGTYDVWMKRTPSGWKIYKYFHNTAWNEGNFWIYERAGDAAGAASDPVK